MITLLAAVGAALTVVVVFLSVRGTRRMAPVRPWLEATRIGLGITAIVLMAVLAGVSTQPVVAVVTVVAGLVLGYLQGAGAEVRLHQGRLYWRRTLVAMAVWGAGVVVMQVAAVLDRSGAFALGQAVA